MRKIPAVLLCAALALALFTVAAAAYDMSGQIIVNNSDEGASDYIAEISNDMTLEIPDGGLYIIGSPGEPNHLLLVKSGGTLIIEAGGEVTLNYNAKIIVEDTGVFIIKSGGIIKNNTANAVNVKDADGTDIVVGAGQVYTHCSVIHSANDGSGTVIKTAAAAGVDTLLPDCLFTAPAGKTFAGWSLTSDGVTLLKAGAKCRFFGETTLYAVWETENAPDARYSASLNVTDMVEKIPQGGKIYLQPADIPEENNDIGSFNLNLDVTGETVYVRAGNPLFALGLADYANSYSAHHTETFTVKASDASGISPAADLTAESGEPDYKIRLLFDYGDPPRARYGRFKPVGAKIAIMMDSDKKFILTFRHVSSVEICPASGEPAVKTEFGEDNGYYYFPACEFTLPEGKLFGGWLVEGASDAPRNTGDSYKINGDIRIYPNWVDPVPITVSVVIENGAGGFITMNGFPSRTNSVRALPGEEVTVAATPFFGYEFDCWTINGKIYSHESELTKTYIADTVLTAKFVKTPSVPIIVSQPKGGAYRTGDTVTLSVSAVVFGNEGELSYRWYKDGVSITGAREAVYTIPAAALTDAGVYHVEVTNKLNYISETASSRSVAVTVSDELPLKGDYSGDGEVNADDAALLIRAVSVGSRDLTYDYNGDGRVSYLDVFAMARELILDGGGAADYFDVTGDGRVTLADIMKLIGSANKRGGGGSFGFGFGK